MTFDLIDKHCSELSRKNHRIIIWKVRVGKYKLVFLFFVTIHMKMTVYFLRT